MSESAAEDIRIRAADWLMQKHVSDDWSKADQVALDQWLAQSPAHLLAYWRLDAAWSRTERLAALGRPARVRAVFEDVGKVIPFLIRAAAVVLLAAVSFVAFTQFENHPAGERYVTSVGGHETIKLADGTLIELNTDTALRLLSAPDRRQVWLEKGEAYFQVAHNPHRPFSVMVGNRRVTDIGTKFVIRRNADFTKVSVLDGEVSVSKTQQGISEKAVSLSRGEVFLANADKSSVKRATASEMSLQLTWRRGVLVFYQRPLAQAVEELNRYNSQKIVIASPDIGRLVVTGTLSAGEPEQFVRMAHNLFGLHVERKNEEILISR